MLTLEAVPTLDATPPGTLPTVIAAGDLQVGDRIWCDVASGWYGPRVAKVEVGLFRVHYHTVNGGHACAGPLRAPVLVARPVPSWVDECRLVA